MTSCLPFRTDTNLFYPVISLQNPPFGISDIIPVAVLVLLHQQSFLLPAYINPHTPTPNVSFFLFTHLPLPLGA